MELSVITPSFYSSTMKNAKKIFRNIKTFPIVRVLVLIFQNIKSCQIVNILDFVLYLILYAYSQLFGVFVGLCVSPAKDTILKSYVLKFIVVITFSVVLLWVSPFVLFSFVVWLLLKRRKYDKCKMVSYINE